MNKLKPVLTLLRQAFVILLITLVLTEIVFRCYNYFRPSFIFYDSSYNRFRGKPNAPDYDFHLNSKGFKDVEFSPQKAAGTYRILGLLAAGLKQQNIEVLDLYDAFSLAAPSTALYKPNDSHWNIAGNNWPPKQ